MYQARVRLGLLTAVAFVHKEGNFSVNILRQGIPFFEIHHHKKALTIGGAVGQCRILEYLGLLETFQGFDWNQGSVHNILLESVVGFALLHCYRGRTKGPDDQLACSG